MSPKVPPQKDNEANAGTRIEHDSRLTAFFSLASSIAATVFFIAATATLLVTWLGFGISPFDEPAKLEQSNSLADQHVEVGNTFLDADELEAAKEEFDKALQLAPGHTDAQEGAFKADLFLDITKGEPATTSTSISESRITQQRLLLLLEENPDDADALTYLACMSLNIETALDHYQRAVEIDPEQALAYSGMADIYRARGKSDEHIEMAKRAHELAPWKSIFHNNYAFALSRNGRYQDAIAEYEDLVYSDAQYLWAYSDLAGLYRDTGDLQNSYSYGKQFVQLSADEEIMAANREEQAVFYTSPESAPVLINADSEKRYYGYYDIALTSYLRGRSEEAKSYVDKAEAMQIDPNAASEIKRLLNSQIETLQEKQEQFKAKTDDFGVQFL